MKNQYISYILYLTNHQRTTYNSNNNQGYSPLTYLIDFLESGWGIIASKDIQESDFVSADFTYNQSIICPDKGDICFIFAPLDFYENLSDYDHQYHKYLTSDISFKITKMNFVQIAELWSIYRKQKKPYLFFWVDVTGITYLEAFTNEKKFQKRFDELIKTNLIIDNFHYDQFHNNSNMQQIEPMTFYLKAYKKDWGYSCIGRTPQYGLGELLRFLQKFYDATELAPSSPFMYDVTAFINQQTFDLLWNLSIDRILQQKNSAFSYIFAFQNPTIPYLKIKNEQDLIPYFNVNNSLKFLTQNLPEIFAKWHQVLITRPTCVLFWQDSKEWIYVEPFESEQTMSERIKELEKL